MAHYPMRIVSHSGKVHAAERLSNGDVRTACQPNVGLVGWSESDRMDQQDTTCQTCRRVLDRIARRLS